MIDIKKYKNKVKIKDNIVGLTHKYTDFVAMQNVGSYWIEQLKSYLPISQWIQTSASVQILLWAFHITWLPIWIITVFLIIKYYIMIAVRYFSGRTIKRIGILEAQNNYLSKQDQLAPYQKEQMETLNDICKKLDIKSRFTKL